MSLRSAGKNIMMSSNNNIDSNYNNNEIYQGEELEGENRNIATDKLQVNEPSKVIDGENNTTGHFSFIPPEFIKFRTIPPKSRDMKRALNDKESLEKTRLANRKGILLFTIITTILLP